MWPYLHLNIFVPFYVIINSLSPGNVFNRHPAYWSNKYVKIYKEIILKINFFLFSPQNDLSKLKLNNESKFFNFINKFLNSF